MTWAKFSFQIIFSTKPWIIKPGIPVITGARQKSALNKIREIDPDHILGFKGLGIISALNEDYNDAHKKFSYVASINPNEEDIHYMLGYVLYELGEYQEALEELALARMDNPELMESDLYTGLCYIKLKEYDRGIGEFEKLLERFPGDPDYQYYLSYAYAEKGINIYHNGDYSQAVRYLSESNNIYRLIYTINYLRIAYIRLGEYEKAEEFIQAEILKKNYEPEQIYFQHALDIREVFLANYDAETGGELIKNLNRSLQYIDNPQAYYYIGNTYVNMDQYEQGLENSYIAFERDPSNTYVHLDIMRAHLYSNRFDKCIEFYNSVFSDKPDYSVTDDYLALMNYLMISATRLVDENSKYYEKKLSKYISRGFSISDEWSFDPYKTWLNEGDFTQEDKDFLLELTAKMERAQGDVLMK